MDGESGRHPNPSPSPNPSLHPSPSSSTDRPCGACLSSSMSGRRESVLPSVAPPCQHSPFPNTRRLRARKLAVRYLPAEAFRSSQLVSSLKPRVTRHRAPTKPEGTFVRRDVVHALAPIPRLRRQGGTADPHAAGSAQRHDAGPVDCGHAREQPSGGGRRDYRARLNRADGCERRHVRRRPTPPL